MHAAGGRPGIDQCIQQCLLTIAVRGAVLRERARQRNLDIIQRVNAYLDPVCIDYERDVLPLTPAGTATETAYRGDM